MYSLLKMGVIHCYVSLPEGNVFRRETQVATKVWPAENKGYKGPVKTHKGGEQIMRLNHLL